MRMSLIVLVTEMRANSQCFGLRRRIFIALVDGMCNVVCLHACLTLTNVHLYSQNT